MRNLSRLCAALVIMSCLLAAPAGASAAALTITKTVQGQFDKMVAAVDFKLRAEMNSSFTSLAALQQQDSNWDANIKTVRGKNTEAERQLRKQLQSLDAARISRMDQEVKSLKAKHRPLFEQYTALNKRIQIVKPLKNKELNAALQFQKELMKTATTLARQEIRAKEANLKSVKDRKNQTAKQVRSVLAEATPIKTQVKAEKSKISAKKKQIAAEWKSFKLHAKNKNVKLSSKSLSSLVSMSRQLVSHKQTVHALELKISGIIAKAKARLG